MVGKHHQCITIGPLLLTNVNKRNNQSLSSHANGRAVNLTTILLPTHWLMKSHGCKTAWHRQRCAFRLSSLSSQMVDKSPEPRCAAHFPRSGDAMIPSKPEGSARQGSSRGHINCIPLLVLRPSSSWPRPKDTYSRLPSPELALKSEAVCSFSSSPPAAGA